MRCLDLACCLLRDALSRNFAEAVLSFAVPLCVSKRDQHSRFIWVDGYVISVAQDRIDPVSPLSFNLWLVIRKNNPEYKY